MLYSVAKPVSKKPARAENKPPQTVTLPCGCRLGYGQILGRCEVARELYRAILAVGPYVQSDDPGPQMLAYEAHFTEQLEQMETQ